MKTEIPSHRNCNKCGQKLPLTREYFYLKTDNIFGFTTICIQCNKKRSQDPKVKERNRNFQRVYMKRPEVAEKRRQYFRRPAVKQKRQQRDKNRKQTDPLFNVKTKAYDLVRLSIKNNGFSKNTKTANIIGCSWQTLLEHLNSDKLKTTDKNVHIDHIIPTSLAETEEEVIALNHYKNLRLMSKQGNMVKSNKLPSIFELNSGIPDLAFQVYMRNV